MEKEVIIKKTKELLLKIIDVLATLLCVSGWYAIFIFHKVVPFFPILFLFDFCLIGYPIFLRYILKKKWYECTQDVYLRIKYILMPNILMALFVLLYYYKITAYLIELVMENIDLPD